MCTAVEDLLDDFISHILQYMKRLVQKSARTDGLKCPWYLLDPQSGLLGGGGWGPLPELMESLLVQCKRVYIKKCRAYCRENVK